MKLTFVTTNRAKFNEVKGLLKSYDIELEQLDISYEEDHDKTISEIAANASLSLANKLKKPIVVDDTGVFFSAYKNFPGPLAKFVFQNLGYKGIFKLLKNESREGYFETAIGFCRPGGKPQVFLGRLKGRFVEKKKLKNPGHLPYMQIFIPKGFSKTIDNFSSEEKNQISHRTQAFRQLGEYLLK
jgi:non-canonical purine NTP pyrophosphatase (RdgB/HAM1 family)